MLERYKRTFFVTQALIATATVAIFLSIHVWQGAAVLFAAMQIGAITGALWAARLKRKIERGQGLLIAR